MVQTNHLSSRESQMNSTALIVSDDLILRSEMRNVLNAVQIPCTCSGTIGFERTAASSKFEAILIDIPDPDATVAAISDIRRGKLNRYAIILAFVLDGQAASAAWTAGANFTVRRSGDIRSDLTKALQSAHGLILREKRRYYRQPVNIDAELVCGDHHSRVKMLDISERGACIELAGPLPRQRLQLRFLLPGLPQALAIEAVPAWIRGTKTGIQFTTVDETSRTALSQWLISQLDPTVTKERLVTTARAF